MIAACRREWVDFLPALKGRDSYDATAFPAFRVCHECRR